MKKKRTKILLLYAAVILVSWVIVGLASSSDKERLVTGLRPVMINAENNHFLAEEDVEAVVREIQGRPIEEVKRGDVKIAEIEHSLEENPYVKEAEAYREMSGEVVVKLELRKPMARLVFKDGSGYYVDEDFQKVALSGRYSANTILVRGLEPAELKPRSREDFYRLEDLREFVRYVHGSEFLRAQVSELVVEPSGDIVIYPEIGDVVIEFGKPENVAQKFADLEFFYRRVLNYAGWETYRRISLKFKDQIVAKR